MPASMGVNMIAAVVLAAFATAFALKAKRDSILFPFYREGDCEQIGFVPFRSAVKRWPVYRLKIAVQFTLPLFLTFFLLIWICLEYLYPTPGALSSRGLVLGMALWLIVMVVELNVRGSLLLLALPFAVGYLFGRSLYAGYVGIAIVVGVAFLFEAVNIYMFELVGKRQQWKTGRSLDDRPLTRGSRSFILLQQGWLIASPLFMAFTLLQMALHSKVGAGDFLLSYLPAPPGNPSLAAPMALVFLNGTIVLLGFGGVFGFLQRDFFDELGKRILFKRENPEQFRKEEDEMSRAMPPPLNEPPLGIDHSDRVLPLAPTLGVHLALVFLSLDAILTLSTTLGVSLLPGIAPSEISTLSSIVKLPAYGVIIIGSILRIRGWAAPHLASKVYRDFVLFLSQIQQFHRKPEEYINVAGNAYLLQRTL